MAEGIVYILCAVTSLFCFLLLTRGYLRSKVRLLLWSSWAFAGLALNNIILFLDLKVTWPDIDLSVWRSIPAVLGLGFLLFGLIWDAK